MTETNPKYFEKCWGDDRPRPKINLKKWRADVEAAKGKPARLTLLYSIRSHFKGTMHRTMVKMTWDQLVGTLAPGWMKKPNGDHEAIKEIAQRFGNRLAFAAENGRKVVFLEWEDQARYVEPHLKEYEMPPKSVEVEEFTRICVPWRFYTARRPWYKRAVDWLRDFLSSTDLRG